MSGLTNNWSKDEQQIINLEKNKLPKEIPGELSK